MVCVWAVVVVVEEVRVKSFPRMRIHFVSRSSYSSVRTVRAGVNGDGHFYCYLLTKIVRQCRDLLGGDGRLIQTADFAANLRCEFVNDQLSDCDHLVYCSLMV